MSELGFFGTAIAWLFYAISLVVQFFVVGLQLH
jgi:hypothetical protein